MLMDRAYMRSDYPRPNTSVVVWIIATLVAAFIMELLVLSPWFAGSGAVLVRKLSLTTHGFQTGQLWTLATHSFLHSTSNPFHILFSILGIILIGRELEPMLGTRRFLVLYAASLATGALFWTVAHWSGGGAHIGASAGVTGLLMVLICLNPNQEFNFLVLFLFPVTVRAKHFGYALLVFSLIGLVYEINFPASSPYAPSSYLGGMLVGWIYFRYFHANNGWDRAATLELPSWPRRGEKVAQVSDTIPLPFVKPLNIRAEVDHILDKINTQGFASLNEREKNILDEAKDMLSRP